MNYGLKQAYYKSIKEMSIGINLDNDADTNPLFTSCLIYITEQ